LVSHECGEFASPRLEQTDSSAGVTQNGRDQYGPPGTPRPSLSATALDGRSPGSRVNDDSPPSQAGPSGERAKRPDTDYRLFAYSCGGSPGFTPGSLLTASMAFTTDADHPPRTLSQPRYLRLQHRRKN